MIISGGATTAFTSYYSAIRAPAAQQQPVTMESPESQAIATIQTNHFHYQETPSAVIPGKRGSSSTSLTLTSGSFCVDVSAGGVRFKMSAAALTNVPSIGALRREGAVCGANVFCDLSLMFAPHATPGGLRVPPCLDHRPIKGLDR